jgi:crotonobetainyl-CoA:carnitine CoA-transferase CaiB-like acyl-CoA transferase
MIRLLHALHRARGVEALAVAIAAAGAATIIGGLEFAFLDAVAPWADIAAGLFAATGALIHWIDKKGNE